MNIFGIDTDTTSCATYHTDRHIVKMPLETAQMVSFVYYHKDLWDGEVPNLLMNFSAGHDKHPCSLWLRENLVNFLWTCEFGIKLIEEYRFRYDSQKHERCKMIFEWSLDNLPNLPVAEFTPFAKAMPEEYKVDCSIESYRNYYKLGKSELHQWTKRNKPEWI
jgi:hypothetical protein